MNIKYFLILFFLFISVNIFAQNKTVAFFAESFEGVSAKVIQKIERSDKFCLAVAFDENKYIKKEIQNLIFSHKIEPMLNIMEPYFPLISSQIKISPSIIFDKTDICKDILNNYKNNYRKTFELNKHGLYLKGTVLTEDSLNAFYKSNILWSITDSENGNKKGLFIKNNVALFVPYRDFPTSETKITKWFSSLGKTNVIPIILKSIHIKNEKFMLALIDFLNKNDEFDVELPINTAFYYYNKKPNGNIDFKELQNIPTENILQLYFADKEISKYNDEQDKNEEIYSILCDEFLNMCSYDIINGIINNNSNSLKIFNISYANIFRLLNKKVPNINEIKDSLIIKDTLTNEENNSICKFVYNNNSMMINNEVIYFNNFVISTSNGYINFKIDTDLKKVDSIDIYIDMNGISYTGSHQMLKPLNAFFVPENSWEFAIRITQDNIYVYKYSVDSMNLIDTIPNIQGTANIKISTNVLRGNPYNWNYQVIAIKGEEVLDFIETKDIKEKMFKTLPLQIKMYNYY